MKLRYILLGLGLLMLSGCSGGGSSNSTPLPPINPITLGPSRKGLYFGYFGVDNAQVDETKDHTNLLFETMWGTLEETITRMQKANQPTILCVRWYISNIEYYGKEVAQSNLRSLFNQLRAANVLKNVMGLYPFDEPDLNDTLTDEVLKGVITDLKEVANEYLELENVVYVVTYSKLTTTFPGISYYDWVGIDVYGEDIFFPGGRFDKFKALVRPDQKLTLVPGGASPWKEDLLPFYNKAQEDQQVIAIFPFLWISTIDGANTMVGIRENGMADRYSVLGKNIKQAQ